MKIALYLGSFNPFHNGHLEVVKAALNDFKMDKVIIVPTMQNPWKKEKVLDIDKRINIIYKTIYQVMTSEQQNEPYEDEDRELNFNKWYVNTLSNLRVSDIEKELIPPYYSYATLHALKNKYCKHEVFILCGEDTIKDIPDWMNGEAIIQDYNFLVCDRPENAISSTKIRELIKNEEDISNYVNVNVINLIKKYYENKI